jgi:hypothetical protein
MFIDRALPIEFVPSIVALCSFIGLFLSFEQHVEVERSEWLGFFQWLMRCATLSKSCHHHHFFTTPTGFFRTFRPMRSPEFFR